MGHIQVVANYPDEGFAVMEDDAGKFLMFKEQEELVPLQDNAVIIVAERQHKVFVSPPFQKPIPRLFS